VTACGDDRPLQRFVRGVGAVSVALAVVGLVRPGALVAAGGVVGGASGALPLVVRLAAARQGVVGLALLTRRPTDVRRSAGLFLPLTTVDAVVVLSAVRSGVLLPRAGAMSLAVLAANAWVAARARR
jgi:hypothetical protein